MNVEAQLECVFISILFIENYFIIKLWAIFCTNIDVLLGFSHGSVVKNLPANAGDAASIPGVERSPEKGMATYSSILAWEIQWTEEPGGLQSMGLQKS